MKKIQYFEIYKNLLKIRLVENKIAQEYSKQKIRCPVHLSIGQEAIAAPLKVLLKKNDIVVSGHRAHAHYIGKGGDLKKFIYELYLKEKGFSRGKAGSMHLFDKKKGFYGSSPIVANMIPLGVGMALYNKVNKRNNIVLIFFGDGATEEGVFYESLNFAAVHNLKVIFICENNLYSVYSNLSYRQPKGRKIHKVANSLKVFSIKAEGNDVRSASNALSYSIDFVKKNKKPILIEFSTYRFIEHCGPNNDDNLNYRNQKEINKWFKKDPIDKLYKNLNSEIKKKLFNFSVKFTKELDALFAKAEKSKYPDQKIAFSNLYEKKN